MNEISDIQANKDIKNVLEFIKRYFEDLNNYIINEDEYYRIDYYLRNKYKIIIELENIMSKNIKVTTAKYFEPKVISNLKRDILGIIIDSKMKEGIISSIEEVLEKNEI